MDRHIGGLRKRERESRPRGSLISYRAHSSGFPLVSHLIYLVLSPYLVYLRILPCVHMHPSPKVDSSKEAYE